MLLHDVPPRPRALALAALVLLAAACTAPAPSPTGPGPTPSASPSPSPTASPSPSPTPSPSPSPPPSPVAVVANGVWLPASEAVLATRHPIAVMIDDQELARPQSGLSSADIIYQAPAEGGIPRYMLIFQAGDPPTIGPVRSARRYFVGWAAEWRAAYVHAGGAPNALQALAALDRKLLWNADAERWGGPEGYAWRISERLPPHNLYSSGAKLEALAARLGASAPFTTPAWTFKDPADLSDRPASGSIVVPYQANVIRYRYDRRSDHYVRSTSSASPQLDATTGAVIAPADVVVLFMRIARIPGDTHNRLDVGYLGSGRALVFRDGTLIAARWSKKDDASPTILLYASGSLKGQPVPLVRGQIAIQVVPVGTAVTWKIGPLVIDHSRAD